MKNIFKTAKLHILLQPFFLVIGFLWNSFLTKNLSVSDFGLFSIALTLFSILSILANGGMSSGLMRYIPLYEEQKKLNALKNIYVVSMFLPLIVGLFLYMGVMIGQFYIQIHFIKNFSSIVYILGLYIILNSVISSELKILITKGEFFQAKLNELFFQKILPLVILYFISIYGTLNIKIVSYIFILSYLILSIVLSKKIIFYYKKIKFKNFKFLLNKEYFKYSFYINLTGLISMLYMWSDNLMIGYFLNNYEVGIYSAIFLVAIIVKNFWYMAFSPILLPELSRLVSKNKLEEIKKYFNTLQQGVFVLSIPIFFVFLFFGKDLLSLLFTKEYIKGIFAFYVLIFMYLISLFFGYSSYILSAYGKSKLLFKLSIVTLIINIILNYTLIPKYNIVGASVATGISEFIYSFLSYLFLKKWYNTNIEDKKILLLLMVVIVIFIGYLYQFTYIYIINLLFLLIYILYSQKILKKLYIIYKGKN